MKEETLSEGTLLKFINDFDTFSKHEQCFILFVPLISLLNEIFERIKIHLNFESSQMIKKILLQ